MPNTIPESSVPETLRAMGQRYHSHFLTPEDVAACDAGAHAWEIVRELAAVRLDSYGEPIDRDNLNIMGQFVERARRLVEDR